MMLWEALDAHGQGWLREHVTGPYRLDFYLPSVRLAVEVDGASHQGRVRFEKDALRDAWHAGRGITTRRFSADEVERDLPWVLDEVRRQVTTLAAPPPRARTATTCSRSRSTGPFRPNGLRHARRSCPTCPAPYAAAVTCCELKTGASGHPAAYRIACRIGQHHDGRTTASRC